MSTATATPATITTRVSTVHRLPLWLTTVGAVLAGAVVTGAFEALTRALGVDYVYGPPGVAPTTMPAGGLFFAVLEVGVVGTVLAASLARWARRPRSTWRRTTVALTALSLVPSLIASSTTYATNVSLVASHLIAAAMIIPIVARRLSATNPRRG